MAMDWAKDAIQQALRRFGVELRRMGSVPDAFSVQRRLVQVDEPTIFDVGAHIGSVALKYRALFPRASIWCFEPFFPSFERLQQNLKGDPRIFCRNVAVAERKGTALLNTNLSEATNSLLPTDKRGRDYWGDGLLDTKAQIEVNTISVDSFVLENRISHIDILKLDVQGAEFAVLTGARDVLRRQDVSLVYTELLMCPTYEGQHKFHEYLSVLDSLGYEFLEFFNAERHGPQLIQADVIFVSSAFKQNSPLIP